MTPRLVIPCVLVFGIVVLSPGSAQALSRPHAVALSPAAVSTEIEEHILFFDKRGEPTECRRLETGDVEDGCNVPVTLTRFNNVIIPRVLAGMERAWQRLADGA